VTIATLAAFAASRLVLFLTPGPGVLAMVARTMEAGPIPGAAYGFGILTGESIGALFVAGILPGILTAGCYVLLIPAMIRFRPVWFAWGALRGFLNPKPVSAPAPTSKRGLAATYAAGISMPLSNPKAIAFYLAFLPAFFDLSAVGVRDYALMVIILIAMGIIFIAVYVGAAHRARSWLANKGVKRWADLANALIMTGVAVLLLVR